MMKDLDELARSCAIVYDVGIRTQFNFRLTISSGGVPRDVVVSGKSETAQIRRCLTDAFRDLRTPKFSAPEDVFEFSILVFPWKEDRPPKVRRSKRRPRAGPRLPTRPG